MFVLQTFASSIGVIRQSGDHPGSRYAADGGKQVFCPKCGNRNDDNAFRCTRCGEIIQEMPGADQPASVADDAAMRMLLPVGRSGLAIAAGYVGLFAIALIPAPVALLLGILAVRDIKRNPKKHGMGRAVFAIIMGAAGTIVLAIISVAGVLR